MIQIDPSKIETAFEKAPEEIRNFLSNPYAKQEILDIAKVYGLHIDKLESFHTAIYLFLIGLLPDQAFEKEIGEILQIKGDELSKLIQKLNERFFLPLRLMYEDDEDGVYKPENTPTEQAPKPTGLNLIQKKLNQSVTTTTEEKDYSVNKKSVYGKNDDPYHEPID